MSFIACTENCAHQREGYCNLDKIPEASPSSNCKEVCAYMLPVVSFLSKNRQDSFPYIADEYNL